MAKRGGQTRRSVGHETHLLALPDDGVVLIQLQLHLLEVLRELGRQRLDTRDARLGRRHGKVALGMPRT